MAELQGNEGGGVMDIFASDLDQVNEEYDPLQSIESTLVFSSADMAESRDRAWLYGIAIGWDCEDEHKHDDECIGVLESVASQLGWPPVQIDRLRALRQTWKKLRKATS